MIVAILLLIVVAQFAFLIFTSVRSNLKTDYLFNIVHNLRYRDEDRVGRDPCGTAGDAHYVASVTTTKSRLHIVDRSIRSMLDQSAPPRGVYLYVSDQIVSNEIPARLRALEERGLAIRLVEDVGPHTKLIHALKDHGEGNIITFDDDMIYPTRPRACCVTPVAFPDAWSQTGRAACASPLAGCVRCGEADC